MTPKPNTASSYERLDERSKSHADKLERLELRAEKIEKKLDTILRTLDEAKGGWRMLLIIGGMAGVVGAALTKISTWLPALVK